MARPDYLQVLTDWLKENQEKLSTVTTAIRSSPEMGKAVAELEQKGHFAATIEVWKSGELDFTLMPGAIHAGKTVDFEHHDASTERDMREFLSRCLQRIGQMMV